MLYRLGITEYLALVNLIVVAITAFLICWYLLETRKLRIANEKSREEAEKAREIEFHPWLSGSDLEIDHPQLSTAAIWLPVKNVGKTPAMNVLFDSEFYFRGESMPSLTHKLGFIAPNDVAHFKIVSLGNTPKEPDDESISVTISYSTHLKGSGKIKQDFVKIAGGWMNKGECDYTFTLSTGKSFSR